MDRLFLLLKPDVAARESEIVYKLGQAGFKVFNRRRTTLTNEQASEFFNDWASDPDFDELVSYVTSGPVVALALQRFDGFNDLKKVVGSVDDINGEGESFRAVYGQDELRNGFHVSDNPTSVERDLRLFFPDTPVQPPPTSEEAKAILETTVYPTLLQGLTQLCKEKPANPTAWLGTWLLDNNPNKPRIQEPPIQSA
ncbi:NME NM23 member 5 [Geranomyces variabilis]|uniref:Nucleoside diphosphate kinase n=1 Tax=Geranomyces variabilis TaxID=109894 RepID=A0AAD5TLU7_9FUNG|nr:NME NM23 member 5 [Geranomyces variabilis]